MMKPSKKSMSFATIPGTAAPAVVEELKQAFPEFYPVKNVLDTSMNNTNPPVHVPFCLFNITRMANGEDAQFYGECLPADSAGLHYGGGCRALRCYQGHRR